ncbi:MAG: hypothetical protein J6M91_05020, partial [Methanobrevibacter sp.]|nr:hypothetical protein [Methanobrevibacter sp.]
GFAKLYIYNSLPENITITPISPAILFLSENVDKYQLNFPEIVVPIAIRLNEKTNATFDIKVSDSSDIKTLSLTDKYFIPSTQAFNGTLEISKIQSFTGEVTDHVLDKQMTLIEYNPPENTNGIQILIESNDNFHLANYGGLSKGNYFYPILAPFLFDNNYTIILDDPLKDLMQEQDEKYYISLNLSELNPGQEVKLTVKYNEVNPIEELYYDVTPDYMGYVIGNMSSFLKNMVFYDIIKNPPSPYNDYKVNITQEFEKININEPRPFYEFYRDVKKTLSNFHDANFDILGDKLPGNINFSYYNYCLPFQFYLDYEENQEVYMYIKDFPECSKYYNDSSLIDKINALAKVPVLEINGQTAFDFVQEFGREFYKYKNPDSDFSINIEIIHINRLAFIPLSLEELNHMNVSFNNGETLETKYLIIKEAEESQEKIEEKNEANVTWDESTENGEFKCRVDNENRLNVLVIKSFFYEREVPSIIYRCAKLIYSNDYKTVIITSQLWNVENTRSYLYLQLLFPKMNGKYNMAMKQTHLNEQLFEKDPSKFLDPKTC